ncbi:MAG: FAD-dependent oxidoreductase, partial [Bacteriovoracaceae bacterium]
LGEDEINAHSIIWAAGVAAVDLAGQAGESLEVDLQKGDRVQVNEYLRVKGAQDIYALGDMVYFDDHQLPGTASVAIQQGKYLGRALRALKEGKEPAGFRYKDKGQMATIGRSKAVVQIRKLRLSGLLAWCMWVFIHIYFLIGFRNRVSVLLQWMWSYLTYKKGARIIN